MPSLQQILEQLKQVLLGYQKTLQPTPVPTTNPVGEPNGIDLAPVRLRILARAQACLGQNHRAGVAPMALACVEHLVAVLKPVVQLPPMLHTTEVRKHFLANAATWGDGGADVLPGCIILSVTGTGNGTVPNGHVGVIGEGGVVYSNNSNTGLWDSHLTVASWVKRYRTKGGMRVHIYKHV